MQKTLVLPFAFIVFLACLSCSGREDAKEDCQDA
jgi:hypothetical protein